MNLFHHEHVTIERGAEAEAIYERLNKVPPARPCDRARVEAAIADHLGALDLEPRPVRWIEAVDPDLAARDGFLAFWASHYKKGRPEAPGMTFTATRRALVGGGLTSGGVVGPALREEKDVDRAVKKAARKAVFGYGSAYNHADSNRLDIDVVAEPAGLGRAKTAARAALADKGIHQQAGFVPGQVQAKLAQGETQLEEEVQVASAAAQALEAANWMARAHVLQEAGAPTGAHDRVARVYRPLVDAVEAGLWLFWVLEDEVIAVAAPES